MRRPLLSLLLCGAAVACGDDLDRPSELRSLRVLAVQADSSFAAPGSSPELRMALVDASPSAKGRTPRVAWLGGCDNPPADSRLGCGQALARAASLLNDDDLREQRTPAGAEGLVGHGLSFKARIAADLIERHPRVDGAAVPYGITYTHFIACGGELRKAPTGAEFPLVCVDPATGQPAGQDDVVTGYFPVWAYRELRNQNPIAEGTLLGKAASGQSCEGGAPCPEGESCGAAGRCLRAVARCEADGADSCPAVAVAPRIDPASVELAETASIVGDQAPRENLWVAYFAQRGRLDADARFAHDGELGWSDHTTAWRAPREAGEARLWAVLRDNRGGVSWVFEDVIVR